MNKNLNTNDDDDLGGLLCRPPGMTREQVREFNDVFRSLAVEERSTVIHHIVDEVKKSGVTGVATAVVDIIDRQSAPEHNK